MRIVGALSYAVTLWTIISSTSGIAVAQAQQSCSVSGPDTAKICFAPEVFSIARCEHLLVPHFLVARKNDVQFYFTYQAFLDGKQITDEVVIKYPFKTEDVAAEAASYIQIPFTISGSYELKIKVFTEGSAVPIEKSSGPITLHDTPRVRALVVGISQYEHGDPAEDDPVPNLSFADKDAEAFGKFVGEIFPSPQVVTLTSSLPDAKPNSGRILSELKDAAADETFCSDNDWFIFYFSGHGVIASDGRGIRRYLSTWNLNPKNVDATSLSIIDVFSQLMKIKARNKLIIFDSCFSGVNDGTSQSSKVGRSTARAQIGSPGSRSRQRPKEQFILNHKFVKTFDIASLRAGLPDADTDLVDFFKTHEEHAGTNALYLPAASADHVAEEGLVLYDNGQYSIPATDYNLDADGNAQVASNGHGYYTYILLSQLEHQIPASFGYGDVLHVKNIFSQGNSCTIDFEQIHTLAKAAFISLHTDHPDLQQPDDAIRTKKPLVSVTCIAAQQGGANVPSPQ